MDKFNQDRQKHQSDDLPSPLVTLRDRSDLKEDEVTRLKKIIIESEDANEALSLIIDCPKLVLTEEELLSIKGIVIKEAMRDATSEWALMALTRLPNLTGEERVSLKKQLIDRADYDTFWASEALDLVTDFSEHERATLREIIQAHLG